MFSRARLLACVVTLSAPLALGAPVFGAECLKVKVPDSVKAGNTDLVLNGLGIRKATFVKVKVYVAGLYLPQKSGEARRSSAQISPGSSCFALCATLMLPTFATPSRKDSRRIPATSLRRCSRVSRP